LLTGFRNYRAPRSLEKPFLSKAKHVRRIANMLEFALATPHAPVCFWGPELWPALHKSQVRDLPQPPQVEEEKPRFKEYEKRMKEAFSTIKKKVAEYDPDVMIMIGDDQGELFGKYLLPSLAIYTGPTVSGSRNTGLLKMSPKENRVTLKVDQDLSNHLYHGLTGMDFDLTKIEELLPPQPGEGRLREMGLSHAFARPSVEIMPSLDLPVVLIFLNCYYPPMPSAARCYRFGQALAKLLEERKEKACIFASGGLSHDVWGPRAGWIDEPLDRWFLEKLERGQGRDLVTLFTSDGAQLRAGTGELRNWIVVAGAVGASRAKVLDYIPLYHGVTGLGFAFWEPKEVRSHRKDALVGL
jgi:aromatic ring-opening dioxygenase LigB subunit